MNKILLVCIPILLCIGCKENKSYEAIFNDPILYAKTVHELNTVVMGNNFTPIVASRNYLYANVAAYEVIAAGYPSKYKSLATQLNGLNPIQKPATGKKINFEFASILSFCKLGEAVTFPEGSMSDYVDKLKKLAKDNGMSSEIFNKSKTGRSMIKAKLFPCFVNFLSIVDSFFGITMYIHCITISELNQCTFSDCVHISKLLIVLVVVDMFEILGAISLLNEVKKSR